jgi:hypothetical protein
MTLSNRSISRAEDVVKRALKVCGLNLCSVCFGPETTGDSCDELFIPISGSSVTLGYSNYLSSRPSIASLSSAFSLTENEDEDTRAICRSLWAFEEIDKVLGWLAIVKEAVTVLGERSGERTCRV